MCISAVAVLGVANYDRLLEAGNTVTSVAFVLIVIRTFLEAEMLVVFILIVICILTDIGEILAKANRSSTI